MDSNFSDQDTENGGEWEDISDPSNAPSMSASRSPRRRRRQNKAVRPSSPKRLASPLRRNHASLSSSLVSERKERKPSLDFVPDQGHKATGFEDIAMSYTSAVLSYLGRVLLQSVKLLRTPLSFLIFLYLLTFILGMISTALLQTFCAIPGLSFLPIPMCSLVTLEDAGSVKYADYPSLMQLQTDAFAALPLTGSSSLSMSMKHVEMASADLKVVVQSSTLHRKDVLAEALGKFQEDSKVTSRGLQKFGAMTSGALNQIAAVNDYALDRISSSSGSSEERSFMSSLVPVPWPFTSSLASASDGVILETFVLAMDTLSSELARLIIHAQQELMHLDNLEEDVSLLHTLLAQSHPPNKPLLPYSTTNPSQPGVVKDLVHRLWKGEKTYNEDKLLSKLDEYRVQAKMHVVRALTTLQGFLDELEDLRERVSQPSLTSPSSGSWKWLSWVAGEEVDSRTRIPVEVSMKSIQAALEQLKENRVKARDGQKEELAAAGILHGL